MHDIDTRIAAIAARQHALVTRQQAVAEGASRSFIRHRLASGRWIQVHAGVFLIAGSPIEWETKVHAAVLAGGPGALASHRTAAVLWDLDGFRRGRSEITVERHRLPEHLAVRVHESTDMELAAATVRRGIPTTGLLRTLLDMGCLVRADLLDAAVEQVVRETRHDWPDLYHCLVTHSRRGRNGCGPLRAVLEARYGEDVTDSRFETLVRRLLADAGVVDPVSQFEIRDDAGRFVAEVDLAWPERMVAIELQSKKHHLNTPRWLRDMERLNAATLLGWNVLLYPWAVYVDRPGRIVDEVRTALGGDQRNCSDAGRPATTFGAISGGGAPTGAGRPRGPGVRRG
jgi:hypothetical protein